MTQTTEWIWGFTKDEMVDLNKKVIEATNALYRPEMKALFVPVENEDAVHELRTIIHHLMRYELALQQTLQRSLVEEIVNDLESLSVFHPVIGKPGIAPQNIIKLITKWKQRSAGTPDIS